MTDFTGIFVRIKKGTYLSGPQERKVDGKTFELQKPWYQDSSGQGKVAVVGTVSGGLENRTCRIMCTRADIEYIDADGNIVADPVEKLPEVKKIDSSIDYEKAFISGESEQEAMDRIRDTFEMFHNIATSVCDGTIRGLIVCGPPGIGKSHGVEEVLKRHNTFNHMKNKQPNYEIVKGYASPISIYKTLFNHSAKDHVVVFDDCDDALMDDTALNLLKAALDSGDTRTISWLAESRVLRAEDIPGRFDFKGNVIFLTNYDFERTTSPRLRAHMDAMLSRCHYLDLEISNQRDQLLRIKQVVGDGMLKPYELPADQEAEVVNYVFNNADYLREISLRMVKKIADLRKARPNDWKAFVETTCLKRTAKFHRLYNAQQTRHGGAV